MKVGTDGVLLGAWAGRGVPKKILDIGAGTGLIALMLTQRFPDARITAIEPNSDALYDAEFNFRNSPFAERLKLVKTNIQDFKTEDRFDLIVSNPPFFTNSLVSENEGRTEARHAHTLSPGDLAKATALLAENGKIAVIYPTETYIAFSAAMRKIGFFEERRTEVKPTATKPFHRIMGVFGKSNQPTERAELVIEKYGRHQYSEEYVELTRDFYLFDDSKS
ncbi:methyltransferase [Cryomorphaceae bacterium 1068]|nr:methyltransferase [Cryomorphaceae bacterium 1068]